MYVLRFRVYRYTDSFRCVCGYVYGYYPAFTAHVWFCVTHVTVLQLFTTLDSHGCSGYVTVYVRWLDCVALPDCARAAFCSCRFTGYLTLFSRLRGLRFALLRAAHLRIAVGSILLPLHVWLHAHFAGSHRLRVTLHHTGLRCYSLLRTFRFTVTTFGLRLPFCSWLAVTFGWIVRLHTFMRCWFVTRLLPVDSRPAHVLPYAQFCVLRVVAVTHGCSRHTPRYTPRYRYTTDYVPVRALFTLVLRFAAHG